MKLRGFPHCCHFLSIDLLEIMKGKFDLDERLIAFAAAIIELAEQLPNTIAGRHIMGQMVRSGSAPALHYGEAQGAESRADFKHKMKVALKELRETFNALRIVMKMKWVPKEKLLPLLDENNQLISIFVTSITTAQKNDELEKRKKTGT